MLDPTQLVGFFGVELEEELEAELPTLLREMLYA
jgi:hypothetical protein